MSCNNNCGNCYDCLSEDEITRIYYIVIDIPVYDRIKYKNCYGRLGNDDVLKKYNNKCFMCNDHNSCKCIELSLFYKHCGRYNRDLIDADIEKIKKQIKYDNRQLFRRYILCVVKFRKLYDNVMEERYKPPYGKGYIESKINFEKNMNFNCRIFI